MSEPLVSVNLCVWKPDPRFFPQAVESILNQTFQDFELIIVEDPSEFDGRAMVRHLLDDPRIRYVKNETRTGFVAQKNLAIELSRSPYIAMMDADDISETTRLQEQLAFAVANPQVKVLGCQLTIIDKNNRVIGYRKYPADPEAVRTAMRRFNAIPHPAVFAQKDILTSVGGYDPAMFLAEDYDLWSRILQKGYQIANMRQALLKYRIHAGALKATKTKECLRKTLEVKRKYFFKEFNLGDWLSYGAEVTFTILPASLTYRLFTIVTYRKHRLGALVR
jgi:glycosyltransferase involved in cell wall biosynthesis